MQRLTTVRSITRTRVKKEMKEDRARAYSLVLHKPVREGSNIEFPFGYYLCPVEILRNGKPVHRRTVTLGHDALLSYRDNGFALHKKLKDMEPGIIADYVKQQSNRLSFYMEPTNIMEANNDLVP